MRVLCLLEEFGLLAGSPSVDGLQHSDWQYEDWREVSVLLLEEKRERSNEADDSEGEEADGAVWHEVSQVLLTSSREDDLGEAKEEEDRGHDEREVGILEARTPAVDAHEDDSKDERDQTSDEDSGRSADQTVPHLVHDLRF